jgi:hypothetical protein
LELFPSYYIVVSITYPNLSMVSVLFFHKKATRPRVNIRNITTNYTRYDNFFLTPIK